MAPLPFAVGQIRKVGCLACSIVAVADCAVAIENSLRRSEQCFIGLQSLELRFGDEIAHATEFGFVLDHAFIQTTAL